jgi:hypothetical protein
MKITLIISGLLVIGGLVFFLTSCNGQSTKSSDSNSKPDSLQIKNQDLNENHYFGLRQMALDRTPEQLELSGLQENEVYGVVMDWDIGKGIVSLITYKTGDASMYLSSGGGIIGGGQHVNVNKASKQFVKFASNYIDKSVKADSTPIPDKNCVRFYFLTANGKYFAQEQMKNIENESSVWLDYFNEANNVISELRKTTEK